MITETLTNLTTAGLLVLAMGSAGARQGGRGDERRLFQQRLRAVLQSQPDPGLVAAWRDQARVRERLRRYTRA